MSQYPPNYQPPSYPPGPYPMDFTYYAPASDLLAPARRAAITMWVIGGLFLLCGMCAGLVLVVPTDQLMAQMGNNAPPGMTPEQITHQAVVAAAILVVLSLFLISAAFFVRRGGQGSLITGMVFCGIIVVIMGIDVISSMVMAGRNPVAMLGMCILTAPLGLLVLTMVWLAQALRNGPQLRERNHQLQAQMWQYQQQVAAGGYGLPPAAPQPGYGGYASPGGYGAPPVQGSSPAYGVPLQNPSAGPVDPGPPSNLPATPPPDSSGSPPSQSA